MSSDVALSIAASLCCGLAVYHAIYWVVRALRTDDLQQSDQWRYDVSRINELRRIDATYRLFPPLIVFFARLNRVAFASFLPRIGRDVQAAGLSRFWLPEEYLGRLEFFTLLLSPA